MKKHRANRFSPMPKFSFPERGKDTEYCEYKFSPRPMLETPITSHMFHDLFYACYDDASPIHALHKLWPSEGCDIVESLPDDLLDNMPKRDREVQPGAQLSKVEHFWGLVARDQRSALRVLLYMLLSLAPTVWFVFAWLFSWGHNGDLQDATVPVTLSIATLSMVWVVVYSGVDMRET